MGNANHVTAQGGVNIDDSHVFATNIVGRDLNIAIHLQNVNDAASTTRAIAMALGKGDLESESIRAELLGLMEELRKTHSTLIKAISPLRRLQDDPKTFENDFRAVYNDFRDFYDAYDFWQERTHCHKVRQIQERLEKHQSPITRTPQWTALQTSLNALSNSDLDVIEYHYRPFMERFNRVMEEIDAQLKRGDPAQAITLKQVFLDQLAPQYEAIKHILRLMTDTIGEIETALA